MLDDLLLLSGNDIPFIAAQQSVHQPTIKEIAYIGEDNFFIGCELLRFSKNRLTQKDKDNLGNQTDFDIIMSIINDKTNKEVAKSTTALELVLLLMFPQYRLEIKPNCLVFIENQGSSKEGEHLNIPKSFIIENSNFLEFKQILTSIFCFKKQEEEKIFQPSGELAQKIKDKIAKGKAKVAKQKNQDNEKTTSIFNRYISILAVGLQKDINTLMQYTVYQLFDEFSRFELKNHYDLYIQAKIAGATGLDDAENWMKDLYE